MGWCHRKKIRTFTWLLLSLELSASGQEAVAAPNCAALMTVLDQVTSCPENKILLGASVQCLNDFESRIRQARKELENSLVAPNTHKHDAGKVGRQTQSFGFNSSNQRMNAEKLAQLLTYGKNSREEINQYMRNLVIAFTTQGQSPDIDAPGAIEEFSEDECYGEPRKEIEQVLARVDQDLAELVQTKAAAEGLKAASDQRESSLGPGEYGGRQAANSYRTHSGNSKNGRSDVTGLKEDEEKREHASSPAYSQNVSDPGRSTTSAGNTSRISSQRKNLHPAEELERFRNPGIGSNMDPSGRFSNRGSLSADEERARSAKQPTSADSSRDSESSSVGSLFWDKNPNSSQLNLGLGDEYRAPASGTGSMTGGKNKIAEATSSGENVPSPAQPATQARESTSTLFERVSSRYRKLDLFRNP